MTFFYNSQFQVGEWLVKPKENLILKGEQTKQLENRVMNVLIYLSKNNGSTVTIKQIKDAVWKEQIVSNSAVYRAIAELRKALESNNNDAYIKTVSKKGYSLVQPVYNKKINAKSLLFSIVIIFSFILVYSSYDLPSNDKTVNTEQYKFEPATSLKGREFHPALHPDGKILSFISQKERGLKSELYLHLLDVDNELIRFQKSTLSKVQQRSFSLVKSNHHNYYLPTWSNDGQMLAYAELSDDSCQIVVSNFHYDTLSLSNQRKVAKCNKLALNSIQFSSDNQFIAYTSADYGRVEVHLTSITDNKSSVILSPKSDVNWNYRVAASPYDNQLVILQYRDYQETIFYIYDIKTKSAREFFVSPKMVHSLSWGNSKNSIVFSNKKNALKQVNIDSGEVSPFLQTVHELGQLTKASQSNLFAFEQFSRSPQSIKIQQIAKQENEQSFTIASSYQDAYPEFAHNSSKLAFVSNRSGINQLWQRNPNGEVVQLTHFEEETWMGKLRWFKNDEQILFARARNIYIYDYRSQSTLLVLSATADETLFAPSWSSDGQYIFYNQLFNGNFYLYKIAVNSPSKKPILVNNNRLHYQEDSSGQFGYFTSTYKHGLFRLELATGEETLLIPALKLESGNAWRLTEGGIYYLDALSELAGIKYFNLDDSQVSPVMSWPNRTSGTFSIDKHHKLLAHDHTRHPNSDIVLYRQVL